MRYKCLVLMLIGICMGELFSSMAGLEHILSSYNHHDQFLHQYIEDQERRIQNVKKHLAEKHEMDALLLDGTDDSSQSMNPITIYLRIKHSLQEEDRIFDLTGQKPSYHNRQSLITSSDMRGCIVAIGRLIDTYALNVADIVNGRLLHDHDHKVLNAHETMEIGGQFFSTGDYYHAMLWLLEAERRLDAGGEQVVNVTHHRYTPPRSPMNRTILYDYLAYGCYQFDNIEHAVKYSRLLNKIEPTYPTAEYLSIYEELLVDAKSTWDGRYETLPEIRLIRPKKPFPMYEELCRGEQVQPMQDLHCYRKSDLPILRLRPINVEVISMDPRIVVYRNVLTDREIDILIQLASPRLRRALVVNKKRTSPDDEHVAADFRIAQNVWMDPNLHPAIAEITSRIQMMTDLDQSSSELLQVANYGIGGHYEPHYDMAVDGEHMQLNDESHGNRIATLLFYLSSVDAGGATVFTKLGLSVQPTKNDALFWYNVHRNGSSDMRTEHAACPVLLGQKWVANKWLHERGQEFIRPCALDVNT